MIRPQDKKQFWFVNVGSFVIAVLASRLVVFLLTWLLGSPSSAIEPVVAAWGTLLVVYFGLLYVWFYWVVLRRR